MFELSVAGKYLIPRWRQLSVSLISLISILVIALVVWLVVVFFSVTDGLEKMWTQKLIALTAPVRITPTKDYYNSYYFLSDSISHGSRYSSKSIAEKLSADVSDPYDPMNDIEIPSSWPKADRDSNGNLIDPVKLAFTAIHDVKGVRDMKTHDFELAFSQIRLRLVRSEGQKGISFPYSQETQAFLTHQVFLGSLEPENDLLEKSIIPLSPEDMTNRIRLLGYSSSNTQEDAPEDNVPLSPSLFREKATQFFEHVKIDELKTPMQGWSMPQSILPKEAKLDVLVVARGEKIFQLIILPKSEEAAAQKVQPELQGFSVEEGMLTIENGVAKIVQKDGLELPLTKRIALIVPEGVSITAKYADQSIEKVRNSEQLPFVVNFKLQNQQFEGEIPLSTLEVGLFTDSRSALEAISEDGALLPKSFRDAGVLVGDRGYFSYTLPTASTLQEQRVPMHVVGFYDPGIIPLGGKYIVVSPSITSIVRSTPMQDQNSLSNGINIRFPDLSKANFIKSQLTKSFKEKGIEKYWKIETYREFEYTKDLIQQLQSEKNLYSVIALVIITVACSNIISMLIILVNDKKKEIGILRSMGATSASIATIFGLCGTVMGVLGSAIGILAAMITLANLNTLVSLVSRLQGFDMFNAAFYGEILPQELSYEALTFVLGATVVISLLAGIVPAVKASLLRPSAILRSE